MNLDWNRLRPTVFALIVAGIGCGMISDLPYWKISSPDIAGLDGEALVHGVRGDAVSWSMPLPPVLNALIFVHAPIWAAPAVSLLLCLASVGLAMIAGAGLHSLACGGIVFFLWRSQRSWPDTSEMGLFCFALLLVAALLVEDAERPSAVKKYSIALAVALSLLIRSELFLFPLVYFSYLSYFGARRPETKQRLSFLLVPLIVLLPWVYMNYALLRRFVLFENGRADNNIIAGALGLTETLEGDAYRLVRLPPGSSPLYWATLEVARHPLRFLTAYLERILWFAGLFPLRFSLALLGSWWMRRQESVRRLAALAGYYIGIQCLMPVEARYFDPIQPILALIATAFVASLLMPMERRDKPPLFPAWGSLFVFSAIGALASSLVAAYPSRLSGPDRLSQAVAAHPDDAWLLYQRGQGRLGNADASGAAADLLRAEALRPSPRIQLAYAQALAVSGRDDAARRVLRPLLLADPPTRIRAGLLEMLLDLREGKGGAAALSWRSAWTLWAQTDSFARGPSPLAMETTARLRSIDARLIGALLRDMLDAWPASEREDLYKKILRMYDRPEAFASPDVRTLYVERLNNPYEDPDMSVMGSAVRAARSGRRREALMLFGSAEKKAGADPDDLRKLALAYGDATYYGLSFDVLKRLKLAGPKDADQVLELAVRAARSGRREEALRILELAEDVVTSDRERIRRSAECYASLGEYRRAAEILRRGKDDAGGWLYEAQAAAAGGDRASALAAAARAQSLSLGEDDARQLVLIYQGLGEYARALVVADLRIRANPMDARWRNDRGVLRELMGQRDAAISDWKSAIALDPDLPAPYLSLGSLYAASNRRKEAAELYAKALLRPRIKDDAEASRSMIKERAELAR